MEAQSLRLEQQQQQEQQMKLQQQQKQNYGDRADDQIQRYQETLQSLLNKENGENNWNDLDRRGQVASLTRDLLRQLKSPDGNPDGLRRARILKFLYDSRFLVENESVVAGDADTKKCKPDALSEIIKKVSEQPEKQLGPRTLVTLPQFVLDRKMTDRIQHSSLLTSSLCNLARLVPLSMDFSKASLGGAFLNHATLPFIDLSNGDLHDAQLRSADLRFANLENTNLKGADLTGAKLNFANLTNAELRKAKLVGTNFEGALLFYSTRSEPDAELDNTKGSLSWELTRQDKDKDKDTTLIFCPLDPLSDTGDNDEEIAPVSSQAGAKCKNRTYSGYHRIGNNNNKISNRNWASGEFEDTTIENFRLHDIHFTNANLHGAVFRYVQLNDVDFTGANLDGARFENSVLNNVDFTGASIRQMTFVDSSIERPTFKGSQYVLPIELGDYANNLLRLSGRNMDISSASNQSPPARFTQRLLLPLLLAPFPFRPSRVLIWLVPYSPELLFSTKNRQSIP
jgi:uncharacterized protein YjbI with pentapeptide repeats